MGLYLGGEASIGRYLGGSGEGSRLLVATGSGKLLNSPRHSMESSSEGSLNVLDAMFCFI